MDHLINGRDRTPEGRPVFKTGRGGQAVPGGFDSHSLPPNKIPPTPLLQRGAGGDFSSSRKNGH